jgi:hypothetical protein
VNGMLVVLVVFAWAVFLVPAVLRRRAERGPSSSIGDFNRQLAKLHGRTRTEVVPFATGRIRAPQGTASRSLAVARNRQARRRRREVFSALLATAVGSAAVALMSGMQVLWAFHLGIDVLFAGYVLALLRWKQGAVVPARVATVSREWAYALAPADD